MKKLVLMALVIAGSIVMTGCGHNASILGIGTGFRVGGGEYGISYGDGIMGTFVTKDGVRFRAELDATQGFSYDPHSNTYKGIKSLEYRVAPQITGYAVDFARENPEVAKLYYDAMIKYYESEKELKTVEKPQISDDKSKEATTSISDVIKKAIDKAKAIIGKKEESDGADSVFVCNGDCSYSNLADNRDVAYQMSIATKLLTYDGYTHKFSDTEEYYTSALEHFLTQMVRLQEKGKKETPMRVLRVTVKDKIIEDLMFVMSQNDRDIETSCPSCWGDISEE